MFAILVVAVVVVVATLVLVTVVAALEWLLLSHVVARLAYFSQGYFPSVLGQPMDPSVIPAILTILG